MKTMNLRDANQRFSQLVREIEQTGEPVMVLRNGKPAIRITSAHAAREPRQRTPEQEAALQRLLDPRNHGRSPDGWRFNREELWDEIVSPHDTAPGRVSAAPAKKARKRG